MGQVVYMRLDRVVALSFLGAALASHAAGAAPPPETRSGVVPMRAKAPADSLIRESQTRGPAARAQAPAHRVESTTYDAWTVTCRETAGKKECGAVLRAASGENRGQPVLIWEIGLNSEGRQVTIFRVPVGLATKKDNQTVGGGIMIQNGVELKFGNGQARRINFMSCNPRACIGEAAVDDTLVREANANTEATVTVHVIGGQPVPLQFGIKGIDKALSLTRK
jgi:invasion protein IalB